MCFLHICAVSMCVDACVCRCIHVQMEAKFEFGGLPLTTSFPNLCSEIKSLTGPRVHYFD